MSSQQNIKINLLFQSDTSAAMNNIQQLSQALHSIASNTKIGIDNGALNDAVSAARQLQGHLAKAVDVDTGRLDLTKFNASLKQSGQSLQTLVLNLQSAGSIGQQAFINIANAVAQAQTPILQFNQKIKDFGVTLANTAKWQIASKAIHGIEGMMSSAMRHAEDLNGALNDIRIVTGYSSATMADFASQASIAAKELSTTTTEYSKAALIFYQQGLSGQDVTDRADVVVKLSQVTGQSAQQVSDQMTAIWNNFDDGSKSLEYYADVLAKLGAATAADTQEITDGLSKFAAVADTVGLSYETAAAAVATVVDKTKQSADVVGTSFKTIFARMQGLSLGETLEDGVDLNKYSEALSKVGVNVLNAKGEMREMDDILNELGEKWEGFGETTQIAIAQTVGGIRQYNQMIALMDNWDSVKENIDLAADATGELTKQQNIWSESYEASAQRVKQAQNAIYESFINSEDIVKLNDIFAEVLENISKMIDTFGGVGPLILSLAGMFSKILFPIIAQGVRAAINNINVLTGKTAKDIAQMQNLMKAEMTDMMNSNQLSQPMQQQLLLSKDLITAKQKLATMTKNMSAVEAEEAQQRMMVYEAMVLEAQQSLEKQEALRKEIELSEKLLTSGENKKALVETSAKNQFAQRVGLNAEETDDLANEATSKTRAQVTNEMNKTQAGFNEQRKAITDTIQNTVDTVEDPAERSKMLEEQIQKLNELEQVEQKQIERYKLILSLQKDINEESKKDAKEVSVGKVEGFFQDSPHSDAAQESSSQGMISSVAESVQGTSTNMGSIEVDASVGNLETLITKMSDYQAQATSLDTLQKDLQQTFFNTDGAIKSGMTDALQEAAQIMETYDASVEEVSAAEQKYQEALTSVARAQENKQKSGRKDKTATEELKKAKKELSAAEKELLQAQSKSSIILQKSSKSSSKYVKQLSSMEKALKKAANSSKNAEKEIEDINKAFDKLKKGDASGLKDLDMLMKRLKVSSLDTVNGIEVLASSIQEQLLASGMNAGQLDQYINQLLEMGAISPEIANKLRMVADASDDMGNRTVTSGQIAVSALQGIATAAGSVSMAVSGIQMLTSAFDEGNTILESTLSIMSGLSMVIPVLIGGYKAWTAIKKAKIVVDAAEQAAQAAGQAASIKEIAAKGGETVAYWALVAAKIANWIASGPAGWATAALIAGAIAVTVAVVAQTAATEKNTEEKLKNAEAGMEAAEKSNEASNAWQEQSSAVDSLIAEYRSLSEAGEDLTAVQEDLKNSATEVCDAYANMVDTFSGLGDQTFKDLQGNIISYSEAIDKLKAAMVAGDAEATEFYKSQLDTAITPEAMKAAQEGATAAMNATASKMAKDGGAKFENDKVTRHVGGVNSLGGDEETRSVDILKNAGVGEADGKTGFDISLSTKSSGEFLDQYEKLLAAKKKMESDLGSKLDNSDTYREVKEMLDASEEEYEKLKEMQAEADKYGVISVSEKLKSQKFDNGQAMDVTNIDSLEEYDAYRKKILEDPSIKGDPAAEEAAKQWLAAQGHLGEYEDARLKMDHAADVTGLSTDTLTRFYDEELSEEQKKFFLEVDFNKYQTEAAIKAEIERLQKEADKAERIKIAEELELDEDELEAYRNLLIAQNKEMRDAYETAEEFEEAMTKIAVANKRMEKGVKKIADDWDDFNDIMSDSTASAEDISTILPDVNEGLQDMLNLSDEEFELLPADFAQKNWDLVQDVVNGVEGSVDKLRDKAGEEMLLNINGAVDPDGTLKEELAGLHNEIAGFDDKEFKVGVAIDDTNFIQKCNDMISAAGMTAQQAEAYFASMGYDAEIEEKPVTKTTTRTVEYPVIDERTGYPTGEKKSMELTETSGTTAYAIKSITPSGSYGGNTAVKTTAPKTSREGKDKGGGSEPKKAKEVKKTDVVERYKETEDVLDDLRDTLEDVNKATDRLYGASRINQMKKSNQLLQQEIGLLNKKKEEAEAYLASDRKALDAAAKTAGVSFSYDENGNISNYDIQMSSLYNQLNAAIKSANKDGNADDNEQKKIDAIQEKIDSVKDAMSQYDETKELLEDIDNELDDKFYEWQDQNYEILSYELELKIEINDEELQKLDYYLSKTEEDFYQRAEGIALINNKMEVHTNSLSHYEDQIAKLDEAYQKGEISQADYVAGMKELNSSIYDNLSSLQELDKQMMHYYGETLQAMAEEIDKVTAKIEHSAAVLEHYSSLFGLIGRSTDYEKMGIILEGQAEVTKNQMIAAKKEYLDYSQMADEKYQLMMTAETDEAYEMYKQQYEDALAMANEVQDEYLSYAEQYAEQLTAILENSLAKYGQDLENALTGGTSFDQLTSKMERAASLQEEYLTTTNKIYETNKMINTAQQEIDKTTNTVAKQRLKQFINETNQLQKKNKLSQFELDIQQAKYELLLAEIALEEAQDAKSQVRLQRDAEGNFGYVYTADQDKISQAQQELADAQNSLYNISLEGANGYAEKYQQTLNELYDTLANLQQQYLEGAFESEQEYQNAVAEAKSYYYALLEDYSDLYTIAISTDARVLEDSWSREFSSMIYNTGYWKQQVEEYVDNVSDAFKTWEREMKVVAGDTGLGGDFENLAAKVGDITYETEQLTEEIVGPLMSSLQQEVDMVNSVTDAYAAQRDELAKVIARYEALTQAIEDKQMAEMGIIEAKNTAESAKRDTSSNNNSSNSKGNSGNGKPEVGDVVTYTGGKYYYTSNGGSHGERGPGGRVTITQIKDGAKYPIHVWSGDSGYGWLTKEQLSGFDTGGYTGKWGSYGKLAMLHEKELVLNKQDTQNLLQSMELLNNIIQTINLQTANAQLGGLLNSPNLGMPGHNILDQQVQIEAHFPNVSSRIEIEEAFSTLVNRASQYANRK